MHTDGHALCSRPPKCWYCPRRVWSEEPSKDHLPTVSTPLCPSHPSIVDTPAISRRVPRNIVQQPKRIATPYAGCIALARPYIPVPGAALGLCSTIPNAVPRPAIPHHLDKKTLFSPHTVLYSGRRISLCVILHKEPDNVSIKLHRLSTSPTFPPWVCTTLLSFAEDTMSSGTASLATSRYPAMVPAVSRVVDLEAEQQNTMHFALN